MARNTTATYDHNVNAAHERPLLSRSSRWQFSTWRI